MGVLVVVVVVDVIGWMCERVLPVKSQYVRRTRAFYLQPQSFYNHFYLFHSICFCLYLCLCLSSWFWNPTYNIFYIIFLAGPGEIVYVHKKPLLSNWLSINGHFIYAQNTTTYTCILSTFMNSLTSYWNFLHWKWLWSNHNAWIEMNWIECNEFSWLFLSSLISFDLIWLKFDMVLEMHSIFFQLSRIGHCYFVSLTDM